MRHSTYEAREQARWITANASRFIRPDAARFLKPGTRIEDVFPALALKYSSNQPRVPAGSGRESGQWTDGDGAATPINDPRVVSDAAPEAVKPGAQYAQVGSDIKDADGLPYYARGGHHEMPKGVYEKWDLQPETRKVFNGSTTGSLPSGKLVETQEGPVRGHYWDGKGGVHDKYSKAVVTLSRDFMEERGITPKEMTPQQAKELLTNIRNSEEPTIRSFNQGIRMLRRVYRLFRGRE